MVPIAWHVVVVVAALSLPTTSGQSCRTTTDGPKKNKPCAFPFFFSGKLRTSCITDTDPDGRYWCSTLTDANNNHVGGKGEWGYCPSSCLSISFPPPTTPTKTTPTPPPTRRTTPRRTFTRRTTPTTRRPIITTRKTLFSPIQSGGNSFAAGLPDTSSGTYLPTDKDNTCGDNLDTDQIVGGTLAKPGELPFVVALGYRSRGTGKITYNCGATLINRRYVITAAHCHDKRLRHLQITQVVLGEHDTSKDPDCPSCARVQKFDIGPNDVTVHEGWDPNRVVTNGNDIALVRLPRLATTYIEEPRQNVFPICLAWKRSIRLPDGEFLVTGWGRSNNDPSDPGFIRTAGTFEAKQQKLVVPLIPIRKCKSDYRIFKKISDTKHLCAGGELGKDSCSGDSGGPLLTRPRGSKKSMYLKGIVSFGTSKCGQGFPGVYTNVDYYMDWIVRNLRP